MDLIKKALMMSTIAVLKWVGSSIESDSSWNIWNQNESTRDIHLRVWLESECEWVDEWTILVSINWW
jgi:hypothetical protein